MEYCSSLEKRHGRVWCKTYTVRATLHLLNPENFYTWQRNLVRELQQEPNDRTIIWYTDRAGSAGKTQIAKYITATIPSCLYVTSTSSKDISFAIIKARSDPKILIFNLPRTAEGAINYGTFETAKDGIVYSGKYEGGCRLFNPPHIVIMANWMPDIHALSLDRWSIRLLDENHELINE